MSTYFQDRVNALKKSFDDLVIKKTYPLESVNGIYERYENPVSHSGAHSSYMAF